MCGGGETERERETTRRRKDEKTLGETHTIYATVTPCKLDPERRDLLATLASLVKNPAGETAGVVIRKHAGKHESSA